MVPNSWEYQQKAIDDEIHAFKHRRNALAPISSVPAEVMAVIFFHLRSGQPDIHVVLRVAHVCHHWRKIALDHPLLWNHIDFTTVTPAGATEILARAGMVPLYLEARVHSRHWGNARLLAFQKELQTHISHIHHLSISAEHSRLDKTLEGLISPAPTLEHLSLSVEEPLQASVSDTLFDGTAPKLSSLHLRNCDISWKSPLLKGLTNLEINSLSAVARPSLTYWLDALDEMLQLESLCLDSASPFAHHFPIDVERTVTLPLLAELDISASAVDCGLMLAHLILPTLTSLCVTATSDRLTIKKLLPYVVQHAHGPQDTDPLQSALIHTERTQGPVGIIAWLTPNIGLPEWNAELSARVSLFVTSEVNDISDRGGIIEAAMAALPLDSLMTLTIPRPTGECDEWFWEEYMPRWPLLTHAHLAFPPSSDFTRVLGGLGPRKFKDPFLPLLTNLELIGVELEDIGVEWLCRMLLNRVEEGVPLQVLDLRTCYASCYIESLGIVAKLREIIVDVWAPTTRMPYSPVVSDNYSDGDDDSGGDNERFRW